MVSYLTGWSITNTAATASEVVIQDSTATPVILWRGYIGASTSRDITFRTRRAAAPAPRAR
jgi:hypothetical protein